MKQRLELYIAGQRADIETESPVLFNYSVEELRNPTIVKNAYSQQLKLKGTPANNRIFQFYFRADATPGGFDPSKRVPFSIFADGGRTVEAGYVKLNSVSKKGLDVEYAVTLYGGLGGFLYSLQYNDEKVRSFADLVYTKSNGDAVDLGFTINRAAVAEAWQNAYTEASKWSLVNFAPCYNGIPDKFDAGRALVKAAKYGLEVTADSDTYTARNGFAVVDLPGDMNEWQVKDLRSYLQRPVISVRALFRAICDPANNGGYTVELDSAFFHEYNNLFYSAWLTLKKLTSIALPVTAGTDTQSENTMLQELDFQDLNDNASGLVSVVFKPDFITIPTSVAVGTVLSWYGHGPVFIQDRGAMRGLLVQAVVYDDAGNAIGGSQVIAFGPDLANDNPANAAVFAKMCNNQTLPTPIYDNGEGEAQYGAYIPGLFDVNEAGKGFWNGQTATLTVNSSRVAAVKVYATRVGYNRNYSGAWLEVYKDTGSGIGDIDDMTPVSALYIQGDLEFTYQTPSDVRSGAEITQSLLLSDTMSPAEFLLSYCKRFGLSIRIENDRKIVHIEKRSTTYIDTTVTDISARIDRSRDVEVAPVPFDSQKFEFSETDAGAGYAKDYKNRFGLEYGAKRLNTGFEFNSDVKKLLDGTKFKTAPEVKARDLCFLNVTDPGQTPSAYPAVFLNSGLKYHLFASNNRDTNELVVPAVPATAVYDYWDPTYKTYDDIPRLQLCDDDGKGIDGDGVLVLYQGRRNLPEGFYLSDDLSEMYLGNNEKPCWILEARDAFGPSDSARLMAPGFGRFRYGDSRHSQISETVEFGMPMELDIPGATISPNIDVYALFWARYMSDRYSPRTKVMTCYVYTGGMPFDANSLRRFFWIDGAVWCLNKIQDYDLNGNGVCKCEFVQVQDVQNYVSQ